MPRLRTFIAIDPGDDVRDRLVALQENMARVGADVKWVERENLHVTLLFLGEVDDRAVPEVCRTVQAAVAKLPAFDMSIAGAGCFPNPRRPRILWVGVDAGNEETIAIHTALEPPLLELGCYRREDRHFTPHITLGRVRGERPSDNLAAVLAKHGSFRAGAARIEEVHVMSSQLTPRGPQYTIMARARLLGGRDGGAASL